MINTYPRVAVVILNYNGAHFLERFLPSVIEHSAGAEVVVADNASTDRSLSLLGESFPQVRILRLQQNHGFCGGYNRALRQVDADYYVLLNSDVEVGAGWLQALRDFMESHPEVGACQPKVLSHAAPDNFEHAGAAGGFIDALGYPFCRGRIFDSVEQDGGQYQDCVEVFWATGACLMVRASLYQQLGGLDEDFFAHMEEIDFCWRLRNAGHKVAYVGHAHVLHVGGGTLSKENPRKTFLNFRNGLWLMAKNLPSSRLLPVILPRMLLDGVAALRFLLQGHRGDFMAVLRAHMAFYAAWPALRRKRKLQPHSRFDHGQVYKGSIVWDHFVKRCQRFSDLGMPLARLRTRDAMAHPLEDDSL